MPSDAGELPYTAQMFDAVAVIAQAATDAIDAGYEANKTSILRVLQKGKVATPGIGNTDAEGDVTIDDSGNGPKTYEIMNFVGDRWFDVGDWGDEATPKYLPETDFTFAGMEDFYLGDERLSEEQGESAMEIREPLEENGLITPLENLETESDESTDDAQESSDDRPRDSKERVRRYLGTNDENRNQTIEKIPELESTKATTEYETTEEALESSTTAKGGPNVNPVTTEEAKEADTTKRVPKTETTEKAPKSETAEPATQSETTEVPESEMTEKALDSNTTIKDEGNVNPALSPLVTEESQKNESSVQSQKENQATTTDTDEKISPVINTTDASGRSLSIGKMVDHVLELEF